MGTPEQHDEQSNGEAIHEVTLRLTLAADTIPPDWDWVTLLELDGDEAVQVTDWVQSNG